MKHYRHYLNEVKNRTILVLCTWAAVFITCYDNKETMLLSFINLFEFRKINQATSHYIYTGITELFSSYLSIIFFISNQVFLLSLIYQVLKFVSPGLRLNEYYFLKNRLKLFFLIGIGIIFILNLMILPITLEFFETFSHFAQKETIPIFFEARIIEYIDYYKNIYYTIILSFFALFFIGGCLSLFNLNVGRSTNIRHYLYCLLITTSTVITPPDVFSQLIVSFILIFFYEMQLFIAIYAEKFSRVTN